MHLGHKQLVHLIAEWTLWKTSNSLLTLSVSVDNKGNFKQGCSFSFISLRYNSWKSLSNNGSGKLSNNGSGKNDRLSKTSIGHLTGWRQEQMTQSRLEHFFYLKPVACWFAVNLNEGGRIIVFLLILLQ